MAEAALIQDPRNLPTETPTPEPKPVSALEQIALDEQSKLNPLLETLKVQEAKAKRFDLLAKGQFGGNQSLRDLNLREKLKIIENLAGKGRSDELAGLGAPVDVGSSFGGLIGRLFGGAIDPVTPAVDLGSVFDKEIRRLGLETAERVRAQARGTFIELRDAKLGFAQNREDLLRGELTGEQERFGAFVDERLNLLLGETAEQGREARGEVGASLSARGLGRSTAVQRGLEDVTLAEQQQVGQQKVQAFQSKTQARDVVSETIDKIANQRRLLEESFDLAKVQTIDQIKSLIDVSELEISVTEEIARITADAEEGQLFGTIIGGLAGGLAGFFLGGPAGAAAGAAAGTQIGGAV